MRLTEIVLLALVLSIVKSGYGEKSKTLFVLNKSSTKLIRWERDAKACYFLVERHEIRKALKQAPVDRVHHFSDEYFQFFVALCESQYESVLLTEDVKWRFLSVIYPGTKWCGPGDIASGYDDLGKYAETDKCCREHDHCSTAISQGETKFNLTNTALYTISHCSCDALFYDCLKNAKTGGKENSAGTVGAIYFGIAQLECIKKEHPKICHDEPTGWPGMNLCRNYSLDKTRDPIWQFFHTEKKW